jgi:hypothetical protein
MTLRINTASDGRTVTLQLVGRMEESGLAELEAQVRQYRPRLVLDLDDVTLVDAPVVRFLIACEAEGIELEHCPSYVREWMESERRSR